MTKKEVLKNITKKLWNNTYIVGDIKIARVCWDRLQWKVIDNDKNFENITEVVKNKLDNWGLPSRERVYKPIAEFYYQEELAEYLANKL
jgi:hypothetical protein